MPVCTRFDTKGSDPGRRLKRPIVQLAVLHSEDADEVSEYTRQQLWASWLEPSVHNSGRRGA